MVIKLFEATFCVQQISTALNHGQPINNSSSSSSNNNNNNSNNNGNIWSAWTMAIHLAIFHRIGVVSSTLNVTRRDF